MCMHMQVHHLWLALKQSETNTETAPSILQDENLNAEKTRSTWSSGFVSQKEGSDNPVSDFVFLNMKLSCNSAWRNSDKLHWNTNTSGLHDGSISKLWSWSRIRNHGDMHYNWQKITVSMADRTKTGLTLSLCKTEFKYQPCAYEAIVAKRVNVTWLTEGQRKASLTGPLCPKRLKIMNSCKSALNKALQSTRVSQWLIHMRHVSQLRIRLIEIY